MGSHMNVQQEGRLTVVNRIAKPQRTFASTCFSFLSLVVFCGEARNDIIHDKTFFSSHGHSIFLPSLGYVCNMKSQSWKSLLRPLEHGTLGSPLSFV